MKNITRIYFMLLGLAISCLPQMAKAQCAAGQTYDTYCYAGDLTNEVAFEFCPSAGMVARSTITAGTFTIAPHNLSVYSGASGSGTSGTLVFGPTTGDVSGNTFDATAVDECLIFVINSVPGGALSCVDGFATALDVCSESVAGVAVSLTISPDEFCDTDGTQTLGGGLPAGGVYSGTGVTDDGNGNTFTFDPSGLGGQNITVTYTNGGMATDDIMVSSSGSVTFSAPADLCIDAGIQTGLGGGTPTGGVYSGTGVTDDGNGMTYSFNPAIAGLGTHTISYMEPAGCMETAMDDVEVLAACGCPMGQESYFYCQDNNENEVVAFEVCPTTAGNAVQATITGGTFATFLPDGDNLDVYAGASGSGTSGTLIEEDLTGDLSGTMVESTVADQCLTFVVTTGPVASCQDGNETPLSVCGEDVAPSVSFLDPGDFCITDLPQMGLSGGLPTGGVYSSPTAGAVTDAGDGENFTFTAVDGAGTYELIYTLGGGSDNVFVEVFASGVVSFTAPADLCIDAGIQTNLGGGMPAGGTFSGTGVTDNGNGTFDFNPAIAGLGTHTISYTDATGCMETAMDDVEVLAACGCPMGEQTFFHCQDNGEDNLVIFEICPTQAGQTVQANIQQGGYSFAGPPDGDELTIYAGLSGSGTSGRIVFGPMGGNLAGTMVSGSCDNECLTFVSSTGPVGSCQDGFELPLQVCASDITAVNTSEPMADVSSAEYCAPAPSAADKQISLMEPSGTNESVVWILTSAPANSQFAGSEPVEFMDGASNSEFEITSGNKGELLEMRENADGVATAVYGTWSFSAKIVNTVTGCESAPLTGFSVVVNESPTVSIAADPNGDICLGTTDVEYSATIDNDDSGTYAYSWCAYNAANGGGTCFDGFTPGGDNATQMRSWTTSPGPKSIGVTVTSSVAGCSAEDIYDFTVFSNPTISCPTVDPVCSNEDPIDLTSFNFSESPTGGSFSFSGNGVSGNNFDPAAANLGMNSISVEYTAGTGCTTTCNFNITVISGPDDPVAVQMSAEFCSNAGVGNGEKRVRIEEPAGANEGTIWTLTDAPTGSQFDGMEPIEFTEGETNSEFRITGGSKGNTVTMRGEPDNAGTPVYGTWTFDVRVEDSNTGCSSGTETGYFITAFENPGAPTPDVTMAMGCVGQTSGDVSVQDPGNGFEISWEVLEAPADATFMAGDVLAPNTSDSHYRTNQGNNGELLRIKSNDSVTPGTYRFKAIVSNTATGCVSEATTEEFIVEMNTPPADPVAATATKAFCVNPDLAASLANTGVNVSNSLSANEKVVWVLTAAPAGSAYAVNDEFTTDDCGDLFKDFGELAVANSSKVIRVQDVANAPTGTYSFDVYILNCESGCTSEVLTGFSISVYELPAVTITGDLPIGIGRDLCLGQTDVQYNAAITSTDGGTYTYAWCAYNSGDGSGSCFNGFSDNTAQNPTRSWTSSAGMKSVGVTVESDVNGCAAEDLYSFEVVEPTMVACPDDQVFTLITDPMTFDCAADIAFNHPEVTPGPCDPVMLTISISGPGVNIVDEAVTPGAMYTNTFAELGEYMVSYQLVDAVGNMSDCNFMITVDGLPCGWVDNGGFGDCAGTNDSNFDLETETFSVTSNGCVPGHPFTTDNQAFINTQLCGDGYIKALVTDITNKGFGGISLRESQMAGAKKVELGTNRVSKILKALRVIDNYPAFPQEAISFDKFWLKIERSGNILRASASTDDITYVPFVFQSIAMGECLQAGLWAYSTNEADEVTAIFNQVEVVESNNNLIELPSDLGVATSSSAFDVSLAPNPASEQITLSFEQLLDEEVSILIFDINGQIVRKVQFEKIADLRQTIDIDQIPAGTYFVNVRTNLQQKTLKLIKQ